MPLLVRWPRAGVWNAGAQYEIVHIDEKLGLATYWPVAKEDMHHVG